jgi:uncharacterized membrane protein YgdD (TMEM256/DUF423 family)
MKSIWVTVGALLAAASVIAAAAGAHLAVAVESHSRLHWDLAARYLMYGGLGVMAAGLASDIRQGGRSWDLAGLCLAVGSVAFAGPLVLTALGGPSWLGTIMPLGGVLLIAGFLGLAVAGLRR